MGCPRIFPLFLLFFVILPLMMLSVKNKWKRLSSLAPLMIPSLFLASQNAIWHIPTYSVLLIISAYLPLILGPFLFLLEDGPADVYMLSLVSVSTILNVIGTSLFWRNGMITSHIQVWSINGLGEVYGFLIDPMSVCIGLAVSTAGLLFMIYSMDYLSKKNKERPVKEGKGKFYAWMTIFIGATLAFLYSSTSLQLLIFFEVMSVACWGVVGYYRTDEARRASYKALLVTNLGAMVGLYTAVSIGILKLHNLSLYAYSSLNEEAKIIVFLAVMFASFTKSSQFPLYSWLPDAMVAPTPASAFLHGAAMVEMGVFLLARFIQFMSPLPKICFYVMAFLILATQILCVFMYIAQRGAKKLLAYSTIAESCIMYVSLAVAVLGIKGGIQASMFQLFNHAYIKGVAFLAAGSFGYSLGTLNMEKIKGLVRSPVIGWSWTLSLLGLAGIPPFGVFFGKIAILSNFHAAILNPAALAMFIMILVDSSVFLMISLKWTNEMVFSKAEGDPPDITRKMKATMIILLILGAISPYISFPLVSTIGR